ncbi:hypothetical protein Bca52824_018224 [Brassica carinata]|uniref:Uncharacterized protein n=1 Tax=Brassica carinata TaxID=52824 RepID=A0A8X8AZ72_BRACI|nr:hypothetical protein Bca52824_018224 [Brassica carinata]
MLSMQLSVQPMVECGEDKEEGWGEFDCEIHERKVVYMVDELKAGHEFKKWEWGGGDSAEPKYEHTVKEKENKRKTRAGQSKEEEGPALKQRRLSRYFSRKGNGDGGKLEAVEAKLEKLIGVVETMKNELEKQGRILHKRRSVDTGKRRKSLSSSMLCGGRRKRRKSVGTGCKWVFDESDGKDSESSRNGDEELCVDKTSIEEENSDSEGLEGRGGTLRESVVVPLMVGKKGDATQVGHQVCFGSGSNTFHAPEDEDGDRRDERGIDGAEAGRDTEVDFGELNKLVGAITRATEVDADADKVDERRGAGDAREDAEVKGNGEETMKEPEVFEVDREVDNEDDEQALDADKEVMELSDSSPCKRTEKHKPVESEGDLVSLLLAKEPFSMDKIVPEVEDSDYPFFESVLLANPKVLHVDAGGKYDLRNEFFVELGTPQKWVSTQHMEVLVDYVASRQE